MPKINAPTWASNVSFLKTVERQLKRAHILSAASEAEELVRHYGGMNRMDYFTGRKDLSLEARRSVEAALRERVKGKPLSYLLKEKEFFGLRFIVSPDVLIPRPETEILVEEALKILNSDFPTGTKKGRKSTEPQILDLGTGSGCIAVSLTIHRSNCKMTALDISSKALKIARKNINFYHLGNKTTFIKSDLFSAFGATRRAFWDLIISNPPYVPAEDFGALSKEVLSEPKLALQGGPEGLSVIARILDEAPYFMKKNARLLMEIGGGQAPSVEALISGGKKFSKFDFVKDLNGIERVLIARK